MVIFPQYAVACWKVYKSIFSYSLFHIDFYCLILFINVHILWCQPNRCLPCKSHHETTFRLVAFKKWFLSLCGQWQTTLAWSDANELREFTDWARTFCRCWRRKSPSSSSSWRCTSLCLIGWRSWSRLRSTSSLTGPPFSPSFSLVRYTAASVNVASNWILYRNRRRLVVNWRRGHSCVIIRSTVFPAKNALLYNENLIYRWT